MNKKPDNIPFRAYLPVILALVLAAGFMLGLYLRMPESGPSERSFFSIGADRYNKVNDVINYVMESYVDTVSRERLTEEAIVSLLKNLDPHSSYIPASEFQRLTDPLMGSFEGIGIEFNMIKDTVVVVHPIPGGPSEHAGVMPGDRIVMVNDTLIAGVGMATSEVVSRLLGPKGTVVNVSVFRPGIQELLDFSLTRDKIPSYSLDIAYMVDEQVGYIRLNKFSATTHAEFLSALERLNREGMEKMILDLRGNGGGFLDAAIQVADELLEPGKLIVYTQGRRRPKSYASSLKQGGFQTRPLVVLIDEWSASASEIIAGAVQDNDRGLVVGRRSFGKGLVQEQVRLNDGSALRLTVARYYTPTGRSIQKPYDEGEEAYFSEFMQRYHNGELLSPDSIRFDDSLRFETPAGRVVYGGGGIMPDVFVPIDTSGDIRFFNQVSNRGHIYLFAFDYTDRNRISLEGYGDPAGFVDRFRITDAVFSEFLDFLRNMGMEVPGRLARDSEQLIRNSLKAYIGRNVFGAAAFYPILHQHDQGFRKALESLKDEAAMASVRNGGQEAQ